MINDLRFNMENTSLWRFADDGTLSETVYRPKTSSLQNEVDAIYQWTLANNFQLNSFKCKELTITFKKTPVPYESIVIIKPISWESHERNPIGIKYLIWFKVEKSYWSDNDKSS